MIGAIARRLDNLLGRGEAAVTVPALDGALRPNRVLDAASLRMPLEDVDCLAIVGGRLHAAAGQSIYALVAPDRWELRLSYGARVAAIAALGPDGLAIALASGEIVVTGGAAVARRYDGGSKLACITALLAQDDALYVANGSADNTADAWQRDLMERNASGSVWRIDLKDGAMRLVAGGLAWPAGLALAADRLVVSEAWKHRLLALSPAAASTPSVLVADLPAYPGRLASAPGGFWLAAFAPRSQLVEFVLREPAYRRRMMAEVPRPFWIAPTLRSGRSFSEPLQGGGVKHLGQLKAWAPTMSAGLAVRLDTEFRPRSSLHSRADGATHGITSVVEHDGAVFAAARGDGVVVSLPTGEGTGRP